MLSDSLRDLVKVNHGESNYNDPKLIMMLLDTLSDFDKLNYGKKSKYQLCSSKI